MAGVDTGEIAHFKQRHEELTHQIEVGERALKEAKSPKGDATQALQNQIQGYKDELKQVQQHLKDRGVDVSDEGIVSENLVEQAREQANLPPRVDTEAERRQNEAAAENTQNRNTKSK
jgi:hypothetical protein